MIDIMKEINNHKSILSNNIKNMNKEKIGVLSAWICNFLLELPNAIISLNNIIKINDSKNMIIKNILNKNIKKYKELFKNYYNETNEYDENYENINQIEITIIGGFELCIKGLTEEHLLIDALVQIINLLDYCEQFSENKEYWNNLIEKEVEIQRKYTEELSKNMVLTIETYREIYKGVKFNII
jgi:hypothetical protein